MDQKISPSIQGAPVGGYHDLPTEIVNVLNAASSLSIRQHLKLAPKNCCSCPPCVKQENTYSVYAGLSNNAQSEFLRIDEVSDDWNRYCCAPAHPLKLEVRPYLPLPGDANASDLSHFGSDVVNSWASLTASQQAKHLRDAYMGQPPLFTIQRDDGQRCCLKQPCKVLMCCVCFGICEDGMKVYAGGVEEKPGGELGRPFEPPMDRLLGSVKQPYLAGGCFPALELRGERSQVTDTPFAKLEGPYCFGGITECCFSYNFWVSSFAGPSKSGDMAVITKEKPQGLTGLINLAGNAETYRINFSADKQWTPAQKATVVASQILIDYMFFDGSTSWCEDKPQGTQINFCYSSCCGCLIPWSIIIPKAG